MKIRIKQPFGIIVGSHTRNLGGTGVRILQPGEIVDAKEPVTWTSNVWITCADGERGKIECGSVQNLLTGRAEEVEA